MFAEYRGSISELADSALARSAILGSSTQGDSISARFECERGAEVVFSSFTDANMATKYTIHVQYTN